MKHKYSLDEKKAYYMGLGAKKYYENKYNPFCNDDTLAQSWHNVLFWKGFIYG